MTRVLLVEDDRNVRELAAAALRRHDMDLVKVDDGAKALESFRAQPFDLVILDVVLPSVDGFHVCREIRKTSNVPILMLSGKIDPVDVVTGLEAGADDYLRKPFDLGELQARITALLRRDRRNPDRIRAGSLEIDGAAVTVAKNGRPIELSPIEFRLLFELASHSGQALSRDAILSRVWNYDFLGGSRAVDMAIKRLREKIEDDPHEPRFVRTIRGVGYRFDAA